MNSFERIMPKAVMVTALKIVPVLMYVYVCILLITLKNTLL